MGKALKCDHCKKCFDPTADEGMFISIRKLIIQTSDEYTAQRMTSNRVFENMDLCPNCTAEFTSWMFNDKKEHKNEKRESKDFIEGLADWARTFGIFGDTDGDKYGSGRLE